jgi:hypothetical protein
MTIFINLSLIPKDMGYPYNNLIAPAILWKNPGITREKFVDLLDDTHSCDSTIYDRTRAWTDYDPEFQDSDYHNGLEGLASLLRLETTPEFLKLTKPAHSPLDEHNLKILPVTMSELGETVTRKTGYKFQVKIHKKNIVSEPIRKTEESNRNLSVGDIWENKDMEGNVSSEKGLVLMIFQEVDQQKSAGYNPSEPRWKYDLEIMPFYQDYDIQYYGTKEELWKAWPIFHPDNKYGWQKKDGSFDIRSHFFSTDFVWRNDDGRYYLDEKTFDLIPASIRSGAFGYTDLVLTSGALKHNAWKILSRNGLKHFEDFLEAFPDIKAEYERAIWDSQTSLSAKMQNMTVSEFLRYRLLRI